MCTLRDRSVLRDIGLGESQAGRPAGVQTVVFLGATERVNSQFFMRRVDEGRADTRSSTHGLHTPDGQRTDPPVLAEAVVPAVATQDGAFPAVSEALSGADAAARATGVGVPGAAPLPSLIDGSATTFPPNAANPLHASASNDVDSLPGSMRSGSAGLHAATPSLRQTAREVIERASVTTVACTLAAAAPAAAASSRCSSVPDGRDQSAPVQVKSSVPGSLVAASSIGAPASASSSLSAQADAVAATNNSQHSTALFDFGSTPFGVWPDGSDGHATGYAPPVLFASPDGSAASAAMLAAAPAQLPMRAAPGVINVSVAQPPDELPENSERPSSSQVHHVSGALDANLPSGGNASDISHMYRTHAPHASLQSGVAPNPPNLVPFSPLPPSGRSALAASHAHAPHASPPSGGDAPVSGPSAFVFSVGNAPPSGSAVSAANNGAPSPPGITFQAPPLGRQPGGAPPPTFLPGTSSAGTFVPAANVDLNALISAVVQSAVTAMAPSARPADDKMPKDCRLIRNPNHAFTWATTTLSVPSLAAFQDTCLSASDLVRLCPATHSAQERATLAAGAGSLLRCFTRLDGDPGGQVSPLEFAEAYKVMLTLLVAAVAAIPNEGDATRAASGLLWDALGHTLRVADNQVYGALIGVRRAHQLVTQQHTSAPATPVPMFESLAHAMIPADVFGSSDEDYRQYLIRKFDFTTAASMPSVVLGHAMSIARHRHRVDTPAYAGEVKNLFGAWVKHYSKGQSLNVHLLPLRTLLDRLEFASSSLSNWEAQLRHMERPGCSMASLIESFAAPAAAPAPIRPPRRALQVSAVQVADESSGNNDVASLAGEVSRRVISHFNANPLVQQPAIQQPAVRQPVVQQPAIQQPAVQQPVVQQLPVQVHNVQPHGGLHPTMAGNFAPAAANAVPAPMKGPTLMPKPDPALAVLPSRMDASWVAAYGCADLGPPPNAPIHERPWLSVGMVCGDCDVNIALPESFKDVPHVGGDSCAFCAFAAFNQGWGKINWYVMPADQAGVAPKPQGRQNQYVHQTHKCRMGLAVIHRVVRLHRDAGQDKAYLFTPAQVPDRGFSRTRPPQP